MMSLSKLTLILTLINLVSEICVVAYIVVTIITVKTHKKIMHQSVSVQFIYTSLLATVAVLVRLCRIYKMLT